MNEPLPGAFGLNADDIRRLNHQQKILRDYRNVPMPIWPFLLGIVLSFGIAKWVGLRNADALRSLIFALPFGAILADKRRKAVNALRNEEFRASPKYKQFQEFQDSELKWKVERIRNRPREIPLGSGKRLSASSNKKPTILEAYDFESLMALDPYEFEHYVADCFRRIGYTATVTKGSGDGGIDIHIERGGQRGAVQCKRHSSKLGPSPCRELFGVMKANRYKFGFLVCPSGFSDGAFEFSRRAGIGLVGFKRLNEMSDGIDFTIIS